MTNARDIDAAPGGEATTLRRSISAVEALLQRLDDRPAAAPLDAADLIDGMDVLAGLPEDGMSRRAQVLRERFAALDEANRLRAEAAQARAEAAVRGRRLLADAQERAARLIAEARADADQVCGTAARELAAARDDTESAARATLAQAAAAGEAIRRDARAAAGRAQAEVAAWLAEQQETATILGKQCREEARVEAAQIRRDAREEGRRRAEAEREAAVAAAVAGLLADTGNLLIGTGHALSVVTDQIERTATGATRFDTNIGLILEGLREAQRALTGLNPPRPAVTD